MKNTKFKHLKLFTTVLLVALLSLSFSVGVFASAIYDCDVYGHQFTVNENGNKECVGCGMTINEDGALLHPGADSTVEATGNSSFSLPMGFGFIIIGIIGFILLIPVFILLLPVFILLLPVFILLLPVFIIIAVVLFLFISA